MAVEWCAIFCKPRKERQVVEYLRENDIEVYSPALRVKPVNPRSSAIRPYFPRYIFVHINPDTANARMIRWAPGSVGLVEFGGEIATVPHQFIDELRERIAQIEAAGGLHLEGLQRGDPVEITDGAFKGYSAIFDARLSGEDRVRVLLHWLGRQMRVKVNASAVKKRSRRR